MFHWSKYFWCIYRSQHFFDEGERELLLNEISELRNQVFIKPYFVILVGALYCLFYSTFLALAGCTNT
jgi:hypothetical protein